MKGRRNPGWFRKGHDPRRRRGFTREECQRGYIVCLERHPHLGAQWMQLRLKERCCIARKERSRERQ